MSVTTYDLVEWRHPIPHWQFRIYVIVATSCRIDCEEILRREIGNTTGKVSQEICKVLINNSILHKIINTVWVAPLQVGRAWHLPASVPVSFLGCWTGDGEVRYQWHLPALPDRPCSVHLFLGLSHLLSLPCEYRCPVWAFLGQLVMALLSGERWVISTCSQVIPDMDSCSGFIRHCQQDQHSYEPPQNLVIDALLIRRLRIFDSLLSKTSHSIILQLAVTQLTPPDKEPTLQNSMAPGKNHVTAVWFEKMFLCCFFLKAGRKDLTNRPEVLFQPPTPQLLLSSWKMLNLDTRDMRNPVLHGKKQWGWGGGGGKGEL